ncbi:hypothetical protein J437_LFUL000118 [Ladona fulva]|uniref:Uncharacterized protein n=1 Tax=Ladona fulva TaxID=123851 RepID=A0A8K0K5I1_LADFU|nr:hypothetical protein J437_LFUL000118 [Ladona fulva]
MNNNRNSNTTQDGRLNLRRNRSDGRLKTYKSSDDCRAWNLNKRERHDHISDYIASSYERFQGDASEWGRYVPVPVLVDVVVHSYRDELQKLHSKLQKVQQELLDSEKGINVSAGERHEESEDIDIQVEEAIEEEAIFIREERDHEVQAGNIYRQDNSTPYSDEGEYTKGDKHAIMEEEYEKQKEERERQENLMDEADSDSRTQNIRETLAEINTDFDKLMYLKDKEIQSLRSMQDSIPQRALNEEWETSFQDGYPNFYENLKHYEDDIEKKENEVKDLLKNIESLVTEEENKRNGSMSKYDDSGSSIYNDRDHENMEGSGMYDRLDSQNEEFAKLKGELDILSVRLSALESSGERWLVDQYDKRKEESYLNEIQDLQDSLAVCKKALKTERIEKEEVEKQLEKCIEDMFKSKNMADEKDRELSLLKDKLNCCREEKKELELNIDTLSTSRRRSSKQLEKSEELMSDLELQHTREVKSFNEKISQMKKELKQREEDIDELQVKYQKLLEQCDNLKEKLKESDALSENDNMKSQLLVCEQKLSEVEEKYQTLLEECERLKRGRIQDTTEVENAKQLANEFMEKSRECEEENKILRERLEKLEDQLMNKNENEKDLTTANEHEKNKALIDELQKQNENLKSDLENALTQLKHKTGSIDTLNETLNIMKERLEDRDKELVEMRETNEELLAEFLQLKQRCKEEETEEDKDEKLSELEDLLMKCGEEKKNLEIKFEKSAKEFAEMKDSYQKLLQAYESKCSEGETKDQSLSQLEKMLDKCSGEKKDLELRQKELENEIAEMKENYQKLLEECQTQLKYAEEHLDKKDQELSELNMKLRNCDDNRKELELEQQELENELAKMRKTYEKLLEEYQTLQKKEESRQGKENMLQETLKNCQEEKKIMEGRLEEMGKELDRLQKSYQSPDEMEYRNQSEDNGRTDGKQSPQSKDDNNQKVSKQTDAEINQEKLITMIDESKVSIFENEKTRTEKEIADILLHHQTCTVCKKEAERILGVDGVEKIRSTETEESAEEEQINKDGSKVMRGNKGEINPLTSNKESKTENTKQGGKQLIKNDSPEIKMGENNDVQEKDVSQDKIEGPLKKGNEDLMPPIKVSQNEEKLNLVKTSLEGRIDTNRSSTDREDQPTMDPRMNLETSITSSNVKEASIMENKNAEKEIADILLHHQTCTVCKMEAERILSIVDEEGNNSNENEESRQGKTDSKQDGSSVKLIDSITEDPKTISGPEEEKDQQAYANRTLENEEVQPLRLNKVQSFKPQNKEEGASGGNTLPGSVTSGKLSSSEVEATSGQSEKNIQKFTTEYQQERVPMGSDMADAKQVPQIKDDTNVIERSSDTGNTIERLNTSADEKEASVIDRMNEKKIADTLLHHQTCTICKKEAERILSTVDEEGKNHNENEESAQGKISSKLDSSLVKFKDSIIEDPSKDVKSVGGQMIDKASQEDRVSQSKEIVDSTKTSEDSGIKSEIALTDKDVQTEKISESKDKMSEDILEQETDSDIHLEKYITIIEDSETSLLENEKENPERELAEVKLHHQTCMECKVEVECSLHVLDEEDKKGTETKGNEEALRKHSTGLDSEEVMSQSKGELRKDKETTTSERSPESNRMLTDQVNEIELFNEDGSLTKFIDNITETAEEIAEKENQRKYPDSSEEQPAKDDKPGDEQEVENASKQALSKWSALEKIEKLLIEHEKCNECIEEAKYILSTVDKDMDQEEEESGLLIQELYWESTSITEDTDALYQHKNCHICLQESRHTMYTTYEQADQECEKREQLVKMPTDELSSSMEDVQILLGNRACSVYIEDPDYNLDTVHQEIGQKKEKRSQMIQKPSGELFAETKTPDILLQHKDCKICRTENENILGSFVTENKQWTDRVGSMTEEQKEGLHSLRVHGERFTDNQQLSVRKEERTDNRQFINNVKTGKMMEEEELHATEIKKEEIDARKIQDEPSSEDVMDERISSRWKSVKDEEILVNELKPKDKADESYGLSSTTQKLLKLDSDESVNESVSDEMITAVADHSHSIQMEIQGIPQKVTDASTSFEVVEKRYDVLEMTKEIDDSTRVDNAETQELHELSSTAASSIGLDIQKIIDETAHEELIDESNTIPKTEEVKERDVQDIADELTAEEMIDGTATSTITQMEEESCIQQSIHILPSEEMIHKGTDLSLAKKDEEEEHKQKSLDESESYKTHHEVIDQSYNTKKDRESYMLQSIDNLAPEEIIYEATDPSSTAENEVEEHVQISVDKLPSEEIIHKQTDLLPNKKEEKEIYTQTSIDKIRYEEKQHEVTDLLPNKEKEEDSYIQKSVDKVSSEEMIHEGIVSLPTKEDEEEKYVRTSIDELSSDNVKHAGTHPSSTTENKEESCMMKHVDKLPYEEVKQEESDLLPNKQDEVERYMQTSVDEMASEEILYKGTDYSSTKEKEGYQQTASDNLGSEEILHEEADQLSTTKKEKESYMQKSIDNVPSDEMMHEGIDSLPSVEEEEEKYEQRPTDKVVSKEKLQEFTEQSSIKGNEEERCTKTITDTFGSVEILPERTDLFPTRVEESRTQQPINDMVSEVMMHEGVDSLQSIGDEEEKYEQKTTDRVISEEKLQEGNDFTITRGDEKERNVKMSIDKLTSEDIQHEGTDLSIRGDEDERCKQKCVDSLSSAERTHEVADLVYSKEMEEKSYEQKSIDKLALVEMANEGTDFLPIKEDEGERNKQIFVEELESEEKLQVVADVVPQKEDEVERYMQTSIDKLVSEDIHCKKPDLSSIKGEKEEYTQTSLDELESEYILHEVTDLQSTKESEEERYMLKSIDEISSEEMVHEENISLTIKEEKEIHKRKAFDKFGSEEIVRKGVDLSLTKEIEEDRFERNSVAKLASEEILHEAIDLSSTKDEEEERYEQKSTNALKSKDVTLEGTDQSSTKDDMEESCIKKFVETFASEGIPNEEAYLSSSTEEVGEGYQQKSTDTLASEELHKGTDLPFTIEDKEDRFKHKSIDKLASKEMLHEATDISLLKVEEDRYIQKSADKVASKEIIDQRYDQNEKYPADEKFGISKTVTEIEDRTFDENIKDGVHKSEIAHDNVDEEIEKTKLTRDISEIKTAQLVPSESIFDIQEIPFMKQNDTYHHSSKDELAGDDRKLQQLTQESLVVLGEDTSDERLLFGENVKIIRKSDMSMQEGLVDEGIKVVTEFRDERIKRDSDQKSVDGIQQEVSKTSFSDKEIAITPSSKENLEAKRPNSSLLHQRCDVCVKDAELTLRVTNNEAGSYVQNNENISEKFVSKEVDFMEKIAESGLETETAGDEVEDEKEVRNFGEELSFKHKSQEEEELIEIPHTNDDSGTESQIYDQEYENNQHKTTINLEIEPEMEAEMTMREDHISKQTSAPSMPSDVELGKNLEAPQEDEHQLSNDGSKGRDQEIIQMKTITLSIEPEEQGVPEVEEVIEEIQHENVDQKSVSEISSKENKDGDGKLIKPAVIAESDEAVILPHEKSIPAEEYEHTYEAINKQTHEQSDQLEALKEEAETLLHHKDCNVCINETEIVLGIIHKKEAEMEEDVKEDKIKQTNLDIYNTAELKFSTVGREKEVESENYTFGMKFEELCNKDLSEKLKIDGIAEKDEAATDAEGESHITRTEEAAITLETVSEEEKEVSRRKVMEDKQQEFQSVMLDEDPEIKQEKTPIEQQIIQSMTFKDSSMESITTTMIKHGFKSIVPSREKNMIWETTQAASQEKSHPQTLIETSASYKLQIKDHGKEIENDDYPSEYYESVLELESLKSQQQKLNESLKHLEEEKKHFMIKCDSLKQQIAAFKGEEVVTELEIKAFGKDVKQEPKDVNDSIENETDSDVIAENYKQWLQYGKNEEVRLQQQVRILQRLSAKLAKELAENRELMTEKNKNIRKQQRTFLETNKKPELTVLVNVAKLKRENERIQRMQGSDRKVCQGKDNCLQHKYGNYRPQSDSDHPSKQKSTPEKRNSRRHE